jgi:hypothetical protein
MHPIAWKGGSPKFVYRILHIPGPMRLETLGSPGPEPKGVSYILWCWMDMRDPAWRSY